MVVNARLFFDSAPGAEPNVWMYALASRLVADDSSTEIRNCCRRLAVVESSREALLLTLSDSRFCFAPIAEEGRFSPTLEAALPGCEPFSAVDE
jgi:hypothetical protein